VFARINLDLPHTQRALQEKTHDSYNTAICLVKIFKCWAQRQSFFERQNITEDDYHGDKLKRVNTVATQARGLQRSHSY